MADRYMWRLAFFDDLLTFKLTSQGKFDGVFSDFSNLYSNMEGITKKTISPFPMFAWTAKTG